jgi:hypothetical protein
MSSRYMKTPQLALWKLECETLEITDMWTAMLPGFPYMYLPFLPSRFYTRRQQNVQVTHVPQSGKLCINNKNTIQYKLNVCSSMRSVAIYLSYIRAVLSKRNGIVFELWEFLYLTPIRLNIISIYSGNLSMVWWSLYYILLTTTMLLNYNTWSVPKR